MTAAEGKMRRSYPKGAVVTMLALAVSACDPNSHKIAGNYRLRRTFTKPGVTPSDTQYFLWDTARPENEVGWSGTVMRIGWDADHIVVLRAAPPTPRGVGQGWMVIDAKRGTHSQALTLDELRRQPGVANIATVRVDSAWAAY
jgi:hypothetical protein